MILIALLAATVATAEPPPATESAAPAAQAPAKTADADPMICRNEPVTGTLFTKKVCMRKSEKERRAREARDMAQRLQQAGAYVHD